MDIIIGLREDTHWLTDTRLSRNLQNCEATIGRFVELNLSLVPN